MITREGMRTGTVSKEEDHLLHRHYPVDVNKMVVTAAEFLFSSAKKSNTNKDWKSSDGMKMRAELSGLISLRDVAFCVIQTIVVLVFH
jgi:hypothetical protein